MYTLNDGQLNAGFIFLAVALLATLIFGRFVCGWGCHVVAYQDLCAWLLKKVGIKPKPFRSRLLVLAPLALAFYMFFWPTVFRWFVGQSAPTLTNHLMTTEFWKTFPGPGIAVLTVAVCGFAIVYFLGSKGFCTYACPYGGLFGVADQFAVGRIRVTEDCEHCGHCTAVCTSNVRVHEEVAQYGMVVDPGCMKCMDCVSVCPNHALYFGFATPRVLQGFLPPSTNAPATRPAPAPKARHFDFSLSDEIVFALVGVGSLLAYRGLYGLIPLLLAMGMAAITGYVAVKCLHLARQANVRLQNLQLRRGRRITPSGLSFLVIAALLGAFTLHSAAVQWNAWSGRRDFVALRITDDVWLPGAAWLDRASADQQAQAMRAIRRLARVETLGLRTTPAALQDLTWLHLALGDTAAAESTVRRLIASAPGQPEPHRGLAGVLRKARRVDEAEAVYRQALKLDPLYSRARQDLVSLLVSQHRVEAAIEVYRQAISTSGDDADLAAEFGGFLLRVGQTDAAINELRRALVSQPHRTQVRYQLALALLRRPEGPNPQEAVEELRRVVAEQPDFAEGHYHLGVATLMAGSPAEAIPHVRESIRLNPSDAQAYGFLEVVLREMGDYAGAEAAHRAFTQLQAKP